ncbi:S8 family serine peptidase [Anaerobacillus sp. HL2]|nr:S8 family serine peptidase [Anaerobacillus sp. HL2]
MEILEQFPSINAVLANIPQPTTMQYIQTNQQRVKHIELDEKVSIQTSYWSDWGIEKVQSPLAWQQSLTGQGVKVAVIDTGVSEHSDLHIHKGKSFVGYTNSFTDDNGHGTHVAGIIAAGRTQTVG